MREVTGFITLIALLTALMALTSAPAPDGEAGSPERTISCCMQPPPPPPPPPRSDG